jgi:ABC-2 type transport system ATP-binding protein
MMARLRGVTPGVAHELLERFDLVDAADRRAESYSGGMRRRLDLAMSLVKRPEVLFLDEPTTGLDPRSRRAVWEAVQQLTEEGVTVLLTTQYLEEADRLANRIAVIDDGQVIAQGSATELKQRVGEETLELQFADRPPLRVPVHSPESVRAALNAHPDATNIELHRPSLDDVFFAVTR